MSDNNMITNMITNMTTNQQHASTDSNLCNDDIEIGRRQISNQTQNHSDWTTDIEDLIRRWKDQTEKLSHVHQESGYINRTRYYRLAIPSIFIPFIMTLVSQNLYTGTNDPAHIVDGVMFMATSILSSLSLFFNYNQISEEHFQISARYTDISNRIDSELARRRRFRTPSDVFITELKGNIENLGETAPNLPGTWC
jgi:hypothetical protein